MNTVWITLNNECNLRCGWCARRPVGYDRCDINNDTIKCLIDSVKDIGASRVVFSGGEPTLSRGLFFALEHAKEQGLRTTLITNGIRFKDKDFTKDIASRDVNLVSLSLKGFSEQDYFDVTGSRAFGDVISGIRNIVAAHINLSVSTVMTYRNIDGLPDITRRIRNEGVTKFFFAFVYDYKLKEDDSFIKDNPPLGMIEKFEKIYPELCDITDDGIRVSTSFPYCMWSKDIIDRMLAKRQITLKCPVCAQNWLVIEPDLSVVPCNAVPFLKLGVLPENCTGDDIRAVLDGKAYKTVCRRMSCVPSQKCITCDKRNVCTGACSVNYTHYRLDDITEKKNA